MKPRDIYKEIFGLAVRLLGLYFFYVGLKDLDVQTFMDTRAISVDSKDDVITAILPAVFNLAIAWWLIGGGLLIRRAYPEALRIPYHSDLPDERMVAKPAPSQELTGLDLAEKKLAALVEKPKSN